MKPVIERMRHALGPSKFLCFAAVLIWIKTYVVQRFVFELPVETLFQEFILLLSPISSVLLLMWLGLFLSRRRKNGAILAVSFMTSLILFANVVYFRFFNDFITLPVLFQTSNAETIGNSLFELIKPFDGFIFLDFIILLVYSLRKKIPQISIGRLGMGTLFVGALGIFLVNLGFAEIVRPELLTRTFDRTIMVKSIGTYNYHLYDLVISSKTKTQKAFASSSNLIDAEHYVKTEVEHPKKPDKKPAMFGAARGKNVVVISLESTQNFVINQTIYGQEITPFMNDLIQDSFYFDNFYHQTGQGKTSDAEFMMDNSLYPLPAGAVYFTHAQNEYNSTQKILKDFGYYSAVFHANDKTFWNRDNMYKNLGVDRFFAKDDYTITEDNSIGWGLKDIPFMEQSVDLMKTIPQPFYSRMIMLTNHFPFTLKKDDEMVPEFQSNDGTVNRYFTTIRYEDEALKHFFAKMKAAGLYENTIFVLYGDHYGISENHNEAMSEFLGKEITPYEHIELQKVPLIIHIPGMKGKTISKVSGQIDVRPTILNLLGVAGRNNLDFGHNLFEADNDPLITARDGSFITKDYVYTQNTCYRKGFVPEEIEMEQCKPYLEKSEANLAQSDKIIYGDLMRFKDDPEFKKYEAKVLLQDYLNQGSPYNIKPGSYEDEFYGDNGEMDKTNKTDAKK